MNTITPTAPAARQKIGRCPVMSVETVARILVQIFPASQAVEHPEGPFENASADRVSAFFCDPSPTKLY